MSKDVEILNKINAFESKITQLSLVKKLPFLIPVAI